MSGGSPDLGACAPFLALDIEGGAELLVVLLLVGASLAQRVFKAIRESKARQGAPRPTLGGPRRAPKEDPLEGWKALLRGEAQPPPRRPAQRAPDPAKPAKPARAAKPARPARSRRRRAGEVVLSEPLGGLGPVPDEERLERGARPPEREATPALTGAAFSEVPSEADLERAGFELAGATAAPLTAGLAGRAAHGTVAPGRDARAASGWRAAFVAAELLGRPHALRSPDSLPGSLPR